MKRQSLEERLLFRRLEHEEISRETWKECIRTYCHHIYIGPWLPRGSMTLMEQPELWNQRAIYGMVISARDFNPWPMLLVETVIHEFIHITFYTVGIKDHDEASVERLGKLLAPRYAYILEVFEEVYPGLRLDQQFILNSFKKPSRFWLPLSTP